MIFNAGTLARGWLSIAIASGKDKDRPALDRTVCVETYPDGVRLVATDSYMLLHCWVPAEGDELAHEPDLDEMPVSIAVARDVDARGAGLFAHLQKLAEDDETPDFDVSLTIGVGREARQGAFEGLEAEWLVVEHLDHERLKLHTYDGSYPNWRAVVAGFKAESTKAIALNPSIVGRLAKVGKIHPLASLRWWFGGTNKSAQIEVDGYPLIRGFVMPVRWDFETNQPRPEKDSSDGGDD